MTEPPQTGGPPETGQRDGLEAAARRSLDIARRGAENPEPSLGSRLGQVGILGWTIVVPILIGLALGRLIDNALATRALFTAPLILCGAAAGLWSAWRWMKTQ